jgi:hypothetical protein
MEPVSVGIKREMEEKELGNEEHKEESTDSADE